MTTSREQGQAIAALMSALRDDWDEPGCLAAVAAVKDRDPHDVAMAAIRLCATAEAKTPGALKVAGQHWRERVSGATVRYPPKRGEDCRKHAGEWPETCRGCASDRLAGTDSTFNPRRTEAPGTVVQLARANLTQARAQLCSHGVHPKLCTDRHDEVEESK